MEILLALSPLIWVLLLVSGAIIAAPEPLEDNQFRKIAGIVLMALASVAAMMSFLVIGEQEGYRRGQIDALNDEIKYEKVEQPNGELLWEEIDE